MRLKPNPLAGVDELLGVGLGAVVTVLGAAVGVAVLDAVVGLGVVGVTDGWAVGVAGALVLGEAAVTAPRALCAHAVTRHRVTAASSTVCMTRRRPDPSMA
jgi:ABC-type cobalamin transport system permease subunit